MDPYDPELWNLSAAWRILLDNFSAALEAANRAAALRDPYPKSHINAATALFHMQQFAGAKAEIDLAVRQALLLGDEADLNKSRRLAEEHSRPPSQHKLKHLMPKLDRLYKAARRSSDEELEMGYDIPLVDIAQRLITHQSQVRGKPGMVFVPMVAELLSDFTPETVCNAIFNMKQRAPHLMHPVVLATIYLVANCEGVERRDAARLLALILIISLDPKRMSSNYRDLVLATAAVATDQLSSLHKIMRQELGRIDSDLPHLMADQPPITEAEETRARLEILLEVSGPPPTPNPNYSGQRTKKPGFWGKVFG
jgi:hypothetical protein